MATSPAERTDLVAARLGKLEMLAHRPRPGSGRQQPGMTLLPIDHGMTTGPTGALTGNPLSGIPSVIEAAASAGVGGIIAHAGLLEQYQPVFQTCEVPTLLHASASVELGDSLGAELSKSILYPIETALRLGVTGVSLHLNVRPTYTRDFGNELREIRSYIEQAHAHGLPVLLMAYPRRVEGRSGGEFVHVTSQDPAEIAHVARLAAEVGADVVKVPVTDPVSAMRDVVQGTFIPLLLAGGEESDLEALKAIWREAAQYGVSGVAVGRNAFKQRSLTRRVISTAIETFTSCPSEVRGVPIGELAGQGFIDNPQRIAHEVTPASRRMPRVAAYVPPGPQTTM